MTSQGRNSQDYPEIGDKLRDARRSQGLSLRTLADRLGVSPSLISQIERGIANPSVSTLYAIVSELNISLDDLLFSDRQRAAAVTEPQRTRRADQAGAPVQRSDNRSRFRLASGVTWERLTTVTESDVEFLHVVYEVGGASSPEEAFQRHSGHEWGYVIVGELEVAIGFDTYVLGPGDAVSFESSIPHRLANVGDVPVEAVWFVAGRSPVHHAPAGTPPTDAIASLGLRFAARASEA